MESPVSWVLIFTTRLGLFGETLVGRQRVMLEVLPKVALDHLSHSDKNLGLICRDTVSPISQTNRRICEHWSGILNIS